MKSAVLKPAAELLTPDQLSKRWDIDPGTLANWRSQRRGPRFVKLGKGKQARVLYKLSDIEDYERSHTVETREPKRTW